MLLPEFQRILLSNLNSYCVKELGSSRYEMFREAKFTGILNAIDQASPCCVSTVRESLAWYIEGVNCIQEFKARTAVTMNLSD